MKNTKFKYNEKCKGCHCINRCMIKYSNELVNICPCSKCLVKGICNKRITCDLRLKVLEKALYKHLIKGKELYIARGEP